MIKALNHGDPWTRVAAIKCPHFKTKEHFDIAMEDEDPDVRMAFIPKI